MNQFKKRIKNLKFVSLVLMFIMTAFVLVGCGFDLKVELSFDQDAYEVKLDEQLTLEPNVDKGENVGVVNVVYSVVDPTIATYVDGVITPLAVGETTIRVSYKINSKVFAETTLKVLAPTEYEIVYILNGGENHPENPDSYSMLTLPLTLKEPTKAWHTFIGWFETADFSGSEVTILPEGIKEKKTFYAKWEEVVVPEYTISYVLDGGVNSENNPEKYSAKILPLVLEEPTKEGFKFLGWYLDEEFSGEAVTELAVDTEGELTLYAKWERQEYQITYHLDGGINHEANPDKYLITDLPVALQAPTKEGYRFLGWYKKADFSGEPITEITVAGDKELYARWELITYEIIYHLDGGVNNAANPASYAPMNLPITLAAPTKDGYLFLGWYAEADFSGEVVTEIAADTTGDKVFYARFVEIVNYTITFVENGGTWGYATKDELLVAFLTDFYAYVNPSESLNDFIHGAGKSAGYAGTWHSSHSAKLYGANLREADASKPYFINQPEYHAKWVVFFDFIDALVNEVNPDQAFWSSTFTGLLRIGQWVRGETPFNADQLARLPEFGAPLATYNITMGTVELPVPEKDGYLFLGWYETEDFSGEPVTVLNEEVTSDKTFYALWGAEYNIAYELDGGVNHPDNPAKYNTAYLPLVLGEPTKENHLFLGWYAEADFSGEVVTEIAVGVTGDLTLYARFVEIVDYTITFVENGGTWGYATKDELLVAFLTDFYAYVNPSESLNDFIHGAGKSAGYAGTWHSSHSAKLYGANLREADASKSYFINQPEYHAKWVVFFDFIDALVNEVNPDQAFWSSTFTGLLRIGQWVRGETPFNADQLARLPEFEAPLSKYCITDGDVVLPIPVKANAIFLGWYETEDFTGEPVEVIRVGTIGDKTFYARWGENYTITYVLNGGVNDPANPEVYNALDLPIVLAEPTRIGYAFLGWYETEDFSGDAVTGLDGAATGNKTFYAKWESLEKFDIVYVLDGGINHEDNPSQYDESILPIILANPVKVGYTFRGWYDNADFEGEAITTIPAGSTGDITLYAKFEEIVITYNIQYELDGGVNHLDNPTTYNNKVLPLVLKNPTKAGYAFLGWFENADFSGEAISEIPVTSEGDITLYAQWEEIVFNITYETNGGYWRYGTKEEMLIDFLTDFYAYINPGVDLTTFMHGAGKTSGFDGVWHATYQGRLYKANGRNVDPSSDKFINQPEYNGKWLVFFDFLDALVRELNPAQNFWGSTYTGQIRIRNYFIGTTFTADQLKRIPDFSPAVKTFTVTTETITLDVPSKKGIAFLGWYDNDKFAGRPITVIAQGTTGDITLYARWEEKFDINYVVNPEWAGLEAGTAVTHEDMELVIGTNAFAVIQEALDAAEPGVIILLAAGEYEDAATITKDNITIIGPQANVDPNLNNRVEEAVIKNAINVGANVKNLTINGVAFTGMGQVIGDVNGGIDNFVFKYNHVYQSSSAITTGTLYFKVNSGKNSNFYIMNNLFTGATEGSTAPRVIRGSELENLTITDNVFAPGNGQASDVIRLGGTGEESTTIGIGLAGEVNIIGNTFKHVGQYVLFIRRYSAHTVNIVNNVFENVGFASGTYDSTSAINFSNFAGEGEKTVVEVTYNTFKTFKTGIRLEAAGQTSATWEANVNFNKFIDKQAAAGRYVSDNGKNQHDLINAEYNYYEGVDLTEDVFSGVSSYAHAYATEAEVPVLDETGQIPVAEILVQNPVTNLNIYDTYQLEIGINPAQATDKRVTFESSNENVLKVDKNGKLEAVGVGNVIITIKSVSNPSVYVGLSIKVNELPHIEVNYEGTGVLEIGQTLQLTAQAFPATTDSLVWSSSDTDVLTVDQNGLVSAVGLGEAYIIVKLANNEEVKMEVGLVVAEFDEVDALLQYLVNQNEGVVLYQNITAVGYQFTYKHDLYGSVNKFLFAPHEVIEYIVPESNSNRPGPMEPELRYITVHDTGSSAATSNAYNHALYMYNNTDGTTSWHYTVDDRETYQHIPDDEHAWHAGDGSGGPGNLTSIGIETCVNEGSDIYRTWQRTAKLVANLLHKHGLGLDRVRQHYDWSGKNCPQTMRNAGLWDHFTTLIAAEYEIITKYADYEITFESHNPEILGNDGRIIDAPIYSTNVSYTITVTKGDYSKSITLHALVKGKLAW